MKAYSITALGYILEIIIAAESPGQAKAKAAKVCKAIDLDLPFIAIRIKRRPQFDTAGEGVLGWQDYEGRYGVLK